MDRIDIDLIFMICVKSSTNRWRAVRAGKGHWAGIGYCGNTEIKFISRKMESSNYITSTDEQ